MVYLSPKNNNKSLYVYMYVLILFIQIISLCLIPTISTIDNNSNPNEKMVPTIDFDYVIYRIVSSIIGILIITYIIKKKLDWLFKIITKYLRLLGLPIVLLGTFSIISVRIGFTGNTLAYALMVSVILSIIFTIIFYKYPEWYVVNIVCFFECLVFTVVLGLAIKLLPLIALLILEAIEETYFIYKKNFMIKIAEKLNEQKVPTMFMFPRSLKHSFIHDYKVNDEDSKFMMLSVDDISLSTVLLVATYSYGIGLTISIMLGVFVGYILMISPIVKSLWKAGSPFLSGGALLGLLIGSYLFNITLF